MTTTLVEGKHLLVEQDGSEEGGALQLDQIQAALTNLGHNCYGEITFTNVALQQLGLTSIDTMATFPFLQRVSLDGNRISTLRPLEHLHGLVYLSARDNCLSEQDTFPFLAPSAASLERLHLDGNKFTSLSGLASLPYLMDVTVSHNQLTALRSEDFLPLKGLTRFAAHHNRIAAVDPNVFSGARQLRTLHLGHNELCSLHFLAYITTALETLSVPDNRLTALGATVSECRSLVTLDISGNAMEDISELRVLRPARLLRNIDVSGNPFWVDPVAGEETFNSHAAVGAAEGSRRGTQQPVPEGEERVAMDAADLVPAASMVVRPSTITAASLHRTLGKEKGQSDYTALAAPSAYGVVRHVLTASRIPVVPWDLDRAAELAKLPPHRQVFLQVLYLLPSVEKVNEMTVVPEDVARANFFFTDASSARNN